MAKDNPNRFVFTDMALDKKTVKARTDFSDAGCPGLYLRVSPTGRKTFRSHYAAHPSLGEYGKDLSLKAARELVNGLREAKRDDDGRPLINSDLPDSLSTVSDLCDAWFIGYARDRRKRPEELQEILQKYVKPQIGPIKLHLVKPHHVIGAVQSIATKGLAGRPAPVRAGKVLQIIRQMFRWGKIAYRQNVPDNPAADVEPAFCGIQKHKKGERYLRADEIAIFWRGLDASKTLIEPTRLALKIILLTGVRTQEIRLAKWEDIDLEAGTWTIPVKNQKLTLDKERDAKPFVIPLSTMTLEQFHALWALREATETLPASESPWLLSNRRTADAEPYTDKAIARAMRRAMEEKAVVATKDRVSPHDLRRTVKTLMRGELKIDRDTTEAVLNHTLPEIEGTYDRGDYFDERKKALQRWSDFIQRGLNPAGKVRELRA